VLVVRSAQSFVYGLLKITDEWHLTLVLAWRQDRANGFAVEIRRGPLLFTYPIASVSNITQLNATTNPVWEKKFVGMPTAMVPTLVNARLSIYG